MLAGRHQKLSKHLIIDSSTLFAFERAKLTRLLIELNYEFIIPNAVKEEIAKGKKKKK